MTKKRFCKLLMARGYDRNGAARLAAQVVKMGSYSEAFAVHEQFLPVFNDVWRWICEQLRQSVDAIAKQVAPAAAQMVEQINSGGAGDIGDQHGSTIRSL